ncbi:6-pyruvoyl-tetrahydropterin synthase-related protein [Phosphitispora fastidiosa]|uniref:6-pyruvoyl-tetrahydropterin synthase-related protein n=1 Tax=Phosphitispora fastidiosa TaxID=2837202 RepID=UPI001E2BF352|nr:6-pyruvoyl tetrahydropterin synthase-like protein [Phosphitispora fastidiosa]
MQLHLTMSFFLSARHWVTMNGIKGEPHTHIWEISLRITSDSLKGPDLEIGFTEIETIISGYLSYFEGKTLNMLEKFQRYNPSTENLGVFFSLRFRELLSGHGFILEQLTIKESPTRGFTVSDLQNESLSQIEEYLQGELYPGFESPGSQSIHAETVRAEKEAAVSQEDVSSQEIIVQEAAAQETADTPAKKDTFHTIAALAVLFGFNLLLYSPVLFSSLPWPWGSDAWAHLYKTEFLYDSLQQGNWFPRYMPAWDNGIDPFRYWAPLAYYGLVVFRFFTGNAAEALIAFLFTASLIGSWSWLLFRKYVSLSSAAIMGFLWPIVPYNLYMAFASGNALWVLGFAFFPVLVYLVMELQEDLQHKKLKILALVAVVNLIVLAHAMVAALLLVGVTLFVMLLYIFRGTGLKRFVQTVLLLVLSIAISGWWLVPSQIGGVAAIDKEAVIQSLNYYNPLHSFNPLIRLTDPEKFYIGLGYLLLAALAVYNWKGKTPFQKAGIFVALGIFLITTPAAKPFYGKLPLSHLLWPERFVPVGVGFLILGGVDLRNLKERLKQRKIIRIVTLVLVFGLLLADCLISTNMIKTRDYPEEITRLLEKTKNDRSFKTAVLDLSKTGSVPSYIISRDHGREQVFGAAWQGAQTSHNLMMLNTSLEKGWYNFLFDRLIELGTTHIIVLDETVKEPGKFREEARQSGFVFQGSENGLSLYVKEAGPYMVSADYRILGIGKFAPNLAMIYPEIKLGRYSEVDKYSIEELMHYESLMLSGFDWVSKKEAEDLVLEYVQNGGRVVIDLSGAPEDVFSKRASFLGVVAEPVILETAPVISANSKNVKLAPIPEESLPWKTFVLEGVDEVSSLVTFYDRKRPIEGYKIYRDQNIYFMGLNLPYYGFLTGDEVILDMIGNLLHTEPGQTPVREIVEFSRYVLEGNNQLIDFSLPKRFAGQSMVIPAAYLDSMNVEIEGPEGAVTGIIHNLIEFQGNGGEYRMKIVNKWPEATKAGGILTLLGIISCIWLIWGDKLRVQLRGAVKKAAAILPIVVILTTVSLFLPPAVLAAENIAADGEFGDWEAQVYIDDPQGDIMNVSHQTETAGDTRRLYWGTDKDGENLYFSIIRYPSLTKQDQKHKMTGKIFFDTNDNGDYGESVDKIGFFRYDPGSGMVAVKVFRVDDQNNSPAWHTIGKWGEKAAGKDEGLQFEFFFPLEELGIISNQSIRFYATTSFIANDNPKQDDDWVLDPGFDDADLYKHDFDLIPDEGDILYSPVPVLGYPLLGVLLAMGLAAGALLLKKKQGTANGIN